MCKSNINDSSTSYGQQGGDCYVDLDSNMIPVYYTGDEQNPEWTLAQMGLDPGEWYDYSEGRWANAVTLRDDYEKGSYCYDKSDTDGYIRIKAGDSCPANYKQYTPLSFMANAMHKWFIDTGGYITDIPLHPDDILGYWVYVPRYSYEVMRRDAIDLVQQPEDFKIKFETISPYIPKKSPGAGCSTSNSPKSYRIGCGRPRRYIGYDAACRNCTVPGTTWATHPAFTWMDEDGNPVELNGIWVGKFETTGSTLPNEKHISLMPGGIGDMYDVAKSMGVEDRNNKYGNTTETNLPNQNSNNLLSASSHMLKSSEWGAVAYLSASRYGAGVNQVFNNSQYQASYDGDGVPTNGVTGCGPIDKDNVNASGTYTGDDSALGTSAACHGSSNPEYAYNGEIGKLASTTNNVYGVYDMAGGAWEYVMGSYTTNSTQSSTSQFSNAAKPPYVDLYAQSIFDGDQLTNNNLCTWATCGGHALHETKSVQSVSTSNYGSASWGDDFSYFTYSNYQWPKRGGNANDGHAAGLFFSGSSNGYAYADYGFRVILLAN